MPISLSSVSNEILSSTLYHLQDEVVDGLYEQTAFLSTAKRLGKIKTLDGGYKIVVPVQTREHSVVTEITDGYDEIDLTAQGITENAEYDFVRLIMPVIIDGKTEAQNSGEKALVDLAELRYRNAVAALMRQINRQIVRNDFGSSWGAQFGTLNGNTTAGAGGVVSGFLANEDPTGTSTRTMGGLTRGDILGLKNQFLSGSGTFDSSDLFRLETLASTLMPEAGDGARFHVGLMSPSAYDAYRNELHQLERYVDAKTLDAKGAQKLAFSSGFVTPERHLVASGATGDAINSAMLLNLDGVCLYTYSGADFAFTGFENLSGRDARYGKVVFMGGMTANHLASSALYVNAEG